MDHLRCVVERITFQNEENGYTVLKSLTFSGIYAHKRLEIYKGLPQSR